MNWWSWITRVITLYYFMDINMIYTPFLVVLALKSHFICSLIVMLILNPEIISSIPSSNKMSTANKNTAALNNNSHFYVLLFWTLLRKFHSAHFVYIRYTLYLYTLLFIPASNEWSIHEPLCIFAWWMNTEFFMLVQQWLWEKLLILQLMHLLRLSWLHLLVHLA